MAYILNFMDKSYMYGFTMEGLAHYTGRILATFKRAFKKQYGVPPTAVSSTV